MTYKIIFCAIAGVLLSAPVSNANTSSSLGEGSSSTLSKGSQAVTEERADRLLSRADVRQALAGFEQRWISNPPPNLLPETTNQLHGAMMELAFGMAMEAVNSDARRPHIQQILAPPHMVGGRRVPGSRYGIENPDTIYFMAPVDKESKYVLTGKRQKNGPIDSNISYMKPNYSQTISNISHTGLKISPDGTYTVTIDSSDGGGSANHVQLDQEGSFLFIRNTFGFWQTHQADRLQIQRIDGPPAVLPVNDDTLAQMLIERLDVATKRLTFDIQPAVLRSPVNVLPQPGALNDKGGFLSSQRNSLGHFRLNDDQALVVTYNPGDAGYVTFPVANWWMTTVNYWDRQSSLNSAQSWHNKDGTVTVILSSWDPGVKNWIDTSDLREGIIMMRWQNLGAKPGNGEEPWVRSQVVSRNELRKLVPAEMPCVTSVERAREISQRRAAFMDRMTINQ